MNPPFTITAEEIVKYAEFLKYAKSEPNPPEVFIEKKWERLLTITEQLIAYAATLEEPENACKNACKNFADIPNEKMYRCIRDHYILFVELAERYKAEWHKARKAYLMSLKIGEMTGSQYVEFMTLINR